MHGPEHWVGLLVAGAIILTVIYGLWQVCTLVHTRVVSPVWNRF